MKAFFYNATYNYRLCFHDQFSFLNMFLAKQNQNKHTPIIQTPTKINKDYRSNRSSFLKCDCPRTSLFYSVYQNIWTPCLKKLHQRDE